MVLYSDDSDFEFQVAFSEDFYVLRNLNVFDYKAIKIVIFPHRFCGGVELDIKQYIMNIADIMRDLENNNYCVTLYLEDSDDYIIRAYRRS